MVEFVAFDPNVQVNGATIKSVTDGMGKAALPILEAHGLSNVRVDDWVSQQAWLDAFREVATGRTNAIFDLVAIGMAIPDNATMPPEITSIVSGLMSIDTAYHMNHRGGEIGHYYATQVDEMKVDFVCENPYPCDFDYGIIYSMVRRFKAANVSFTVVHDESAECRKKGGDSCTYHVSWTTR